MLDTSDSGPTARLLGKGGKWMHGADATLAKAEQARIVRQDGILLRLIVDRSKFIHPEVEIRDLANKLEITSSSCTPTKVVEFKRPCPAISYKFIVKRFKWFGFCEEGHFKHEQFQKLEESLHGPPIYKQAWFQRYRARKKSSPSRSRP